ncbi:Subtilase family protein isoform 1 [Hibiscus syriacus]|uniref:Subtilase family protein isoform 1 n=1 Tax=Hibiscus syriacus TaxID=106335 RepID=A0A6A2WE37_HIBSY|nr:Subtilase family protein isoform 1 [Hibiscus syriacus]
MLIAFFVGFVAGILAILGLELIVFLAVVGLLNRKIQRRIKHETDAAAAAARNPQHSLDSICQNMQGVVWVLDSEKISSKEQKRRKDVTIEVSPVRKHAKIQDQYLTLTSSDSSCIFIPLKGCIIQAVSATNLPSGNGIVPLPPPSPFMPLVTYFLVMFVFVLTLHRAKRYPLKVESKSSLYNGSKIIYLYLETAWEKESWCKGLRLASCEDNYRWFIKLNVDFHAYMALLSAGYSSFMKPSLGFSAEPTEKGSKSDGSISKVKLFWKRLSKKNSKVSEKKGNSSNQSALEEKKTCEKQHLCQESVSNRSLNTSTEENMAFTSPQSFPRSASQNAASTAASDFESEHEKLNSDEGILCWNLIISRVFFDIKANAALKSSIQARIQRTLSNMRTPNYIGEVFCTNIDIGNLPPYIHAMRLLGNDMNEVSVFEVDAEYCGGVLMDVETRIEVRDLDFQKGIENTNSESNSVENMSSDLLEGFEHFGKHLNLNKEDLVDPRIDCGKGSKDKSGSRLKSVLNNIAKQVSQIMRSMEWREMQQLLKNMEFKEVDVEEDGVKERLVPLTLSVRVVSLRGTLRLYIRPPPSDQLWFGFTSMPDIEFDLESSVGDHKITNGHIALFLINRFKKKMIGSQGMMPHTYGFKKAVPISVMLRLRRSLRDLGTPHPTTDLQDRMHRNSEESSSLSSIYCRSMRELGRHNAGSPTQ